MRIPRVFIDQPLERGARIELPTRQSNYLCKALRMGEGRELWLFNGSGGAYKATIVQSSAKKAIVELSDFDPEDKESPIRIELGIALSKGDRFDYVLQKATELGIAHIRPLHTERVDVRLNKERAEKKLGHWKGIIESACEQSGRNRLPSIKLPQSLDEWAESLTQKTRIGLNPEKGESVRNLSVKNEEIAVLIGPEGGLSPEEHRRTEENYGFSGITLGPRILRTETAPLAIVSLLQCFWGDF